MGFVALAAATPGRGAGALTVRGPMDLTLVVFLLMAVLFDFLNGFHDSSNIVSTMISSRALAPRTALAITAVAEFCGPFLFGVAVATTIGHEVLAGTALSIPVILSALVSAVAWNLLTWYLGIPSSSSHALIGGMIGSALCQAAYAQPLSTMNDLVALTGTLKAAGLVKIVTALVVSPLLGSPRPDSCS